MISNGQQWFKWVPDLPTHPLFSDDTRILQGSPAHLRRIASHPHLGRVYERCTKCRSFPLNQSATGSWRWSNTIQRKLWREKLGEKYNLTDFWGDNSRWLFALARQKQTITEKNFTKSHKTANLQKLAAFPCWSSEYTCYSCAFWSGDFVSPVLRPPRKWL